MPKGPDIDWEAIDLKVVLPQINPAEFTPNSQGKILCKWHNDTTPSMQVYETSLHCFSCGKDANKAEAIAAALGGSKKDAVNWLIEHGYTKGGSKKSSGEKDSARPDEKKHDKPKKRWDIPTLCVDISLEPGQKRKAGHKGNWVRTEEVAGWNYHSASGRILYRASRFEHEEFKRGKEIRPFFPEGSQADCKKLSDSLPDGIKWVIGGVPKGQNSRTLYRLPLISSRNGMVFIVEGEKCASALNKLLRGYNASRDTKITATCWLGGVAGWKSADFSPLDGRKVILWPDNDDASKSTFTEVGEALAGTRGVEVLYLEPSPEWPEKTDVADLIDEGWTLKDIIRFYKAHSNQIVPDDAEKPIIGQTFDNNQYFRLLGHDPDEKLVIYNKRTKRIRHHETTTTSMVFQRLATPSWWHAQYPTADPTAVFSKQNEQLIQQDLIAASFAIGMFDENLVKGKGWHRVRDDESGHEVVVCHSGTCLYVEGMKIKLEDFPGREVWLKEKRPVNWGDPTSPPDNAFPVALAQWIRGFGWQSSNQASNFMGWLVMAPLCGLFPFRPSVWVTGESGVGKSNLITRLVHPLLGTSVESFSKGTTEPTIRRSLRNASLGVILDEFQANFNARHGGSGAIDTILELMRIGSTEGSGGIGKAAGDDVDIVEVRTMFMFFSPSLPPSLGVANENRIAHCDLRKPIDAAAYYEQLEKLETAVKERWPDLAPVFLHWLMHNYQRIIEVTKKGRQIAAKALQGALRNADVYGTLLSAGLFLEAGGELSDSDLESAILAEMEAMSRSNLVKREYEYLLEDLKQVKIDLRGWISLPEAPLIDVYAAASGEPPELLKDLKIYKKDTAQDAGHYTDPLDTPDEQAEQKAKQPFDPSLARSILEQYGVKISDGSASGPPPNRIWIAAKNQLLLDGLRKIRSRFAEDAYHEHLRRIPSALPYKRKRFGQGRFLVVEIPLDVFESCE